MKMDIVRPGCATSRAYGFLLVCVLGSLNLAFAQEVSSDRSDEFSSNAVEQCKANLNRIFEAIVEFHKVHREWPELLSDVHPEFLSDLNCFICPAILHNETLPRERLELRTEVLEDPIPVSYTYEFNLKKYNLWAGFAVTDRDFKLAQMKVVGSNVPIVRCIEYHSPDLALTVGGAILESKGRDWEGDRSNLLPHMVFKDLAPTPGRFVQGIRRRDAETEASLIDLSRHYTSGIQTPWLLRNLGYDLSALEQGKIGFENVSAAFDVRGVIQLTSTNMISPFADRADKIVINAKGRYLHFIEGAVPGEPTNKRRRPPSPGTEIGRYEVRYAVGDSLTIPIRYGQDVLVYDDTTGNGTNGARVVWEGLSRRPKSSQRRVRLYHQRWENPRPNDVIQSLDFVSSMAGPAPFLIAITVEP